MRGHIYGFSRESALWDVVKQLICDALVDNWALGCGAVGRVPRKFPRPLTGLVPDGGEGSTAVTAWRAVVQDVDPLGPPKNGGGARGRASGPGARTPTRHRYNWRCRPVN